MSLFYLCTNVDCNRKYKTTDKLINHMLSHNIILEEKDIPEPVSITNNNKKVVELNKIAKNKKEKQEQLISEINKLKELEMQAKKTVEEKFIQEQSEKYKIIQQEKLQQEQKIVDLDKKWIEMIDKIQSNCSNNSNLCSICFTETANTAPIPCGHRVFCYECIDNYNKDYPHKGCPICRTAIMVISKIYL